MLLLATPTMARIWHVPADAPTIAAGLDSASTGDEVVVSCGTYEETNLQLKSGVTLRSETGAADCVTIDATNVDQVSSVVQCWWQDGARLEGLTITGGRALSPYYGHHGGALNICAYDLEVIDCVLIGNEARAGGAVVVHGEATPVFRRCVITGNTAMLGGGIELLENTVLTAIDCVIVDNTATSQAPDGLTMDGSLAQLLCCEVDLDQWEGEGTIQVFDDDCGTTAIESHTWSAVKSLFY